MSHDPTPPHLEATAHPRGRGAALHDFGWDAALARDLAALDRPDLHPARIVAQHRGRWVATDGARTWWCVPSGRLRHAASAADALPAVGDWVALRIASGAVHAAPGADAPPRPDGVVVADAVLPRRSAFRRKVPGAASDAQVVAANVDVAIVVAALPHDVNPRRLERYVALAWESGATPLVVLAKADRAASEAELADAVAGVRAIAPGVEVLALSARTGRGVEALAPHLAAGRTAVLLGPSGVGKSTLANRLLGHERQRTSEVRADGKGRHTTTHRELLRLASGALLVDTPGMRELALWSDGEADGVAQAFGDVDALAATCRFADCAHRGEPGCAVRAALESGALDAGRHASWERLRREVAHLARRVDERLAAEERSRVRAVHRAHRAQMRSRRDERG